MTKKINYKMLISSLIITILGIGITVGGYYYYKKIYLPKHSKTIIKKTKKRTHIINKKIKPIIKKRKKIIKNKIKIPIIKKQDNNNTKYINITNNKLKENKKIKSIINSMKKEDFKVDINKIKTLLNKKIKLSKTEIEKKIQNDLSVVENKNKDMLNDLELKMKNIAKKNEELSKNIKILNNTIINNNKKIIKMKNSYISETELKEYFTENNNKLTEILSNKFNSIDKQIKNIINKERLMTIYNNIAKLKTPKINSSIKAILANNMKFEYVGFDIKDNDKIAYITLKGDTNIYSVTMDSIIDNKYKIKDLDNNYLYFQNLNDKKMYKLKMLDF